MDATRAIHYVIYLYAYNILYILKRFSFVRQMNGKLCCGSISTDLKSVRRVILLFGAPCIPFFFHLLYITNRPRIFIHLRCIEVYISHVHLHFVDFGVSWIRKYPRSSYHRNSYLDKIWNCYVTFDATL